MSVIYLSETFPELSPEFDPLEPTIFHEPWWLDITTKGEYQMVEVTEHGRVVGRMPFCPRRKFGMTIADMPMLTHFLGPAIVDGTGKANNRILKRMDITHELIRKLPQLSSFQAKCHRDVTDVIAFQANDFRASVQFTHEIAPQSPDIVWKNMRDKGRNSIRLAREKVEMVTDLDPAEFIALYRENIEAKGKTNYLDMDQCHKLVETAVNKGRGKIFAARDDNDELICAIFCVWDNVTSYYLMCTRAPDAQRGVANLLVWEAITDAMNRGLIFDFDGIANEGAARMAANFTSSIAPRYVVSRETIPVRMGRVAKSLIRPPNYFCE